jgi:hypothetical protein
MKKSVISLTFVLLLLIAFSPISNAQEVPASVNNEILGYLRKQPECQGQYVQFDVHNAKIGPRKSGFIGSCTRGGGIYVFYDKTTRGLVKLLQVDLPMNFETLIGDTAHNGYYDIICQGGSGGNLRVRNYRWNGTRYVKDRKSDF